MPRAYNDFNFIPKLIPDNSHDYTNLFIKQYNGHLEYVRNVILREEGINPDDFFKSRVRLFEKFNPKKILKESESSLDLRIPLNLFSIWLTSLDAPAELDTEYLDFAIETSKNNHPKEGWA